MSDTNLSRQADSLQQLTKAQFIRRLKKLRILSLKPQVVDTTVIVYHNLLIQAIFDLKQTHGDAAVKYPLAIAFFAIAGLLNYVDVPFKTPSIKGNPNLNFYYNVMEADKQLYKLTFQLNEWILCLHRFDIQLMVNCLNELIKPLLNIATLTGHDLKNIYYLSIEFYKEFPFFVNTEQALGGLAEVRGKSDYLGTAPALAIPDFMKDYLNTSGSMTLPDTLININQVKKLAKILKRNAAKTKLMRRKKRKGLS
jgi:hypothetical protein